VWPIIACDSIDSRNSGLKSEKKKSELSKKGRETLSCLVRKKKGPLRPVEEMKRKGGRGSPLEDGGERVGGISGKFFFEKKIFVERGKPETKVLA